MRHRGCAASAPEPRRWPCGSSARGSADRRADPPASRRRAASAPPHRRARRPWTADPSRAPSRPPALLLLAALAAADGLVMTARAALGGRLPVLAAVLRLALGAIASHVLVPLARAESRRKRGASVPYGSR